MRALVGKELFVPSPWPLGPLMADGRCQGIGNHVRSTLQSVELCLLPLKKATTKNQALLGRLNRLSSLPGRCPALLLCLRGSWLVPCTPGPHLGSSTTSPDFFQGKHFFLYGEFPGDERRKLSRYVTAFNGSVPAGGPGAGGDEF